MSSEIKEKLINLEKEEKELERKYKYDVRTELEAEQSEKKIKRNLIKTIIVTLLLAGGMVGGTYLANVSLPIGNIIGIFLIVSGFTGTMYFSSIKDAREKVMYAKEHNILKEIEYDKVGIENRIFEIDYYKNCFDTLEHEKPVDDNSIKDDIIILENITRNKEKMVRVRK